MEIANYNAHKYCADICMEGLLNYVSSGRDASLLFGLYALSKSWHYGKVIYYLDLLNENTKIEKEKRK